MNRFTRCFRVCFRVDYLKRYERHHSRPPSPTGVSSLWEVFGDSGCFRIYAGIGGVVAVFDPICV